MSRTRSPVPAGPAASAAASRAPWLAAALVAALVGPLAGCASPEAARIRGGGRGADVGNRPRAVQMHAGAEPYYRTPCVTPEVKCTGPAAVFGPTPPPR